MTKGRKTAFGGCTEKALKTNKKTDGLLMRLKSSIQSHQPSALKKPPQKNHKRFPNTLISVLLSQCANFYYMMDIHLMQFFLALEEAGVSVDEVLAQLKTDVQENIA